MADEIKIIRREIGGDDGKVSITSIDDDRLVLGKLISGSISEARLFSELSTLGFRHGIIETGLAQLAAGATGQMPLATAVAVNLPATTEELCFSLPIVEEIFKSGQFGSIRQVDLKFEVKAGDALIKVTGIPQTVLRYPNGRELVLSETEDFNPSHFAGPNTKIGEDGKTIIAEIDGFASRSLYGVVSVFPATEFPGFGSGHGTQYHEAAIHIQNDIGDDSKVEGTSNIHVSGAIMDARIEAAGNLTAMAGINIMRKNAAGKIVVEQNVLSMRLNSVTLWAGQNIMVMEEINGGDITCLNALIAQKIINGNVKAGFGVCANEISGQSHIYLGSSHAKGQNVDGLRVTFKQHTQRLSDISQGMNQNKSAYLKVQQNLVKQIESMRSKDMMPAQRAKGIQILLRLFNALDQDLEEYRKGRDKYVSTLSDLEKEIAGLDYYAKSVSDRLSPKLRVFNNLEEGTVIHGPSNMLEIEETLKNVLIELDDQTGTLVIKPQDEPAAAPVPPAEPTAPAEIE